MKNKINKYVLVLCSERSGSNLLRGICSNMSGVYICPPIPIFEFIGPLLGRYGDVQDDDVWREVVDDTYGLFCCNHQELIKYPSSEYLWEATKDSQRTIGSLVCATLDFFATVNNAEYVGMKFSTNFQSNLLDLLKQVSFEKIIYQFRDPRDVVLSKFKAGMESEANLVQWIQHWSDEQNAAFSALNQYRGEIFKLSYESLVSETNETIELLSDFLGNTKSIDEILDFHKQPEMINASSASYVWGNLSKPVIPDNSQKFYKCFSYEIIKELEKVCRAMMEKLGYSNAIESNFQSEVKELKYTKMNSEDIFWKKQDYFLEYITSKVEAYENDKLIRNTPIIKQAFILKKLYSIQSKSIQQKHYSEINKLLNSDLAPTKAKLDKYCRLSNLLGKDAKIVDTILELGAGPGKYVALLKGLGYSVIGVDPHEFPTEWEMLRREKGVTLMSNVYAENLPFEDDTMDVVTCLGALLYFTYPVKALSEIRRVLKPGGRLILRNVNRLNLYTSRTKSKLDPASKNLYTRDELRNLLNSMGFNVNSEYSYGFYSPIWPNFWWYLQSVWLPDCILNLLNKMTPETNRVNLIFNAELTK